VTETEAREFLASGKWDMDRSPPKVTTEGETTTVVYSIGRCVAMQAEYPSAQTLPKPYQKDYPDLLETIGSFTTSSLHRDGFADAQATAAVSGEGVAAEILVTVTGTDPAIEGYATIHPAFLDGEHGAQAILGSMDCQACGACDSCNGMCGPGNAGSPPDTCWDPSNAPKKDPWAAMLPLGLPMLNQKTVLFLDYPPLPALTGKDYLNNFTMCRWGRVMSAAGAEDPTLYETIVDARPVAAPGSGVSSYLPQAVPTYDTADVGAQYLTPQLELLTDPTQGAERNTLPVAVFGGDAIEAWTQILGLPSEPSIPTEGVDSISGSEKQTAWVVTNHPDVTSYNCCTQDTACASPSYGPSNELQEDELIDLQVACWLQLMGTDPSRDSTDAWTDCASRWNPDPSTNPPAPPPSAADARTACIQEKIDNGNKNAVCCSWQDAWAYCEQHGDNACATLDCTVDPAIVAKAPPTPSWQEDTCNSFRYFCTGNGD
jgi:hypothetical protein